MKYFFLLSLVYCFAWAEPISAQQKAKAVSITAPSANTTYILPGSRIKIRDSANILWERIDTSSMDIYRDNLRIDKQGRVIALLGRGNETRQAAMLSGGRWKPFKNGVVDAYATILNNGKGEVYISNFKTLLRAGATALETVACTGGADSYTAVAGYDGQLYSIDIAGIAKTTGQQIFVLHNNRWDPAGKAGNPVITPPGHFYKFAVDVAGVPFIWEDKSIDDPTGQNIQRWDGTSWQVVGNLRGRIYDVVFDGKGVLYVAGYASQVNYKFFSKYDGKIWSDVQPPAVKDIEFMRNLSTNFRGSVFAEYYINREHLYRLYQLGEDGFTEVARESRQFGAGSEITALADSVYAIHNDEKMLYRYRPHLVKDVWAYSLPKATGTERSTGAENALKKYFIFQDGNKIGLQDKEGIHITEAVFDEIYIAPAPTEAPVYKNMLAVPVQYDAAALCLRSGTSKIYLNLHDVGRGWLRGYWEIPSSTCNACGGRGRGKDEVKKVAKQGDWVEGKTTTSKKSNYERVWDPKTNSYVGVSSGTSTTNTTKGYYKPDTYSSETITGKTCTTCSGSGTITAIWECYGSDLSGRYVQRWR